ncbi:MAG: BrnT family toxin [Pseudomonadota bacterium]|nr:BrnT family toxin [Pseudomonadota bacterium]
MKITCDPDKSRKNEETRGLPFSLAEDFDWGDALVLKDERKDYGEDRYQALGWIGDRLHMLVFMLRRDEIRIISLRRANRREEKLYDETT